MVELYLLSRNVFMAWHLINRAQGELYLYLYAENNPGTQGELNPNVKTKSAKEIT
jgi:hypothetical protein